MNLTRKQIIQKLIRKKLIAKIWSITFYGLAVAHLSWVISLLTFYFHAAIVLGHVPSWGQPDPKILDIYELYEPLVSLTMSISFISVLVWLGLLPVYMFTERNRLQWKPITVSSITVILMVLLFISPVFEWYVD